MKYVYMIQSEAEPGRCYVGCTLDLKRRFNDHNKGLSPHTRKFLPWKLAGYAAFCDTE